MPPSSSSSSSSSSSLLLLHVTWSSLLPIFVAYSIMILAQTCGPQIIELLHGYEARLNATQSSINEVKFVIESYKDSSSSSPISQQQRSSGFVVVKNLLNKTFKRGRNQLQQDPSPPSQQQLTFCEEYESAHFDLVSDILHVSAMIGLLLLVWLLIIITYVYIIKFKNFRSSSTSKSSHHHTRKEEDSKTTTTTISTSTSTSTSSLLLSNYLKICFRLVVWIPPIYYLPAWVGHFLFQKDIPAVFTYGLTWEGWKKGELCAMKQLFEGRVLKYPHEYGIALVLSILMVLMVLIFQSGIHIPWYDNDDDDIDNDTKTSKATKTTNNK